MAAIIDEWRKIPEGFPNIEKSLDAVWYPSNCLTHIPNSTLDFTLTPNGILTLKKGSTIYIPNGKENGQNVYLKIITGKDLTASNANSGQRFIYIQSRNWTATNLSLGVIGVAGFTIGDTDSKAGTTWHAWYNTAENIAYKYDSNAETPASEVAFPLGIVTSGNGQIESLDMIFSGFGYIGNQIFMLPDVQGLKSNGINPVNEKYISNQWTNTKVQRIIVQQNCHNVMVQTDDLLLRNYIDDINNVPSDLANVCAYDKAKNQMYYRANAGQAWIDEKGNYLNLVNYTYDGTNITEFKVPPIFEGQRVYPNT